MFQSRRLVYRAPEWPADEAFFRTILGNAEIMSNSSAGLLKPVSEKLLKTERTYLEERCLLSVVMCIRETTEAVPTEGAEAEQTTNKTSQSDQLIPIGSLGLSPVPPHLTHHRSSDIGLEILPEYQGKGYGSEGIRWILGWGFDIAGLHRIGIGCFDWNEGAARLYARLGFVEEGRKRECLWHKGKWYGDVTFGMLEHEWREMVRKEGEAGKNSLAAN